MVTDESSGNGFVQTVFAPQVMPAGALVVSPLPTVVTVSHGPKRAEAECGAFAVRVQVPVPEQSPDQPWKIYPASGVAVSVYELPDGK